MHLSPEFGLTVNQITNDGWKISEKVEHLIASDSPTGLAKSIGLGIIGFADLFARYKPDVLVIMGDRFEMMCAALAAQPFGIFVAHIHGGETTQGAIDECFRHSITKMSHLHFATTEGHKKRVIQLGENPERVFNCGAPALENLAELDAMSLDALSKELNIPMRNAPFIVTYHPETIETTNNEKNLNNIFEALRKYEIPVIFTAANADTLGRAINKKISEECHVSKNFYFRMNLGWKTYYNLLRNARAMIGNSSSGIIEAAEFKLPVVNLGSRQTGREHAKNVIHSPCTIECIQNAIEKTQSSDFQKSLIDLKNPYNNGGTSKKICDILDKTNLEFHLLQKKFFDQ